MNILPIKGYLLQWNIIKTLPICTGYADILIEISSVGESTLKSHRFHWTFNLNAQASKIAITCESCANSQQCLTEKKYSIIEPTIDFDRNQAKIIEIPHDYEVGKTIISPIKFVNFSFLRLITDRFMFYPSIISFNQKKFIMDSFFVINKSDISEFDIIQITKLCIHRRLFRILQGTKSCVSG